MQKDQPMTELLDRYERGEIDKRELEVSIFLYIRDHSYRYNIKSWHYEDRMDYLCWLYPRISRAIEKYQNTGSDFDAYIASLIRWSSIEYRSSEADRNTFEYACWIERAKEVAAEMEPEYDEEKTLPPVRNKRQILMLALKCGMQVSDSFAERLASSLGMETATMHLYLAAIRQRVAKKEERIRRLRDRVGAQFYRCIAFEARLQAAPEGSARKVEIQCRLDRARIRLRSMRKRLERAHKGATNREVSEILGVPKGTVDSNLHNLKKRADASYCRHRRSSI